MRGAGDLLLLAAIVALVVDGILLLWADGWTVADGLGVLCFAVAAWAAVGAVGWVRGT